MKIQPLVIEVTNEEVRQAVERKIRDDCAYDTRFPRWGRVVSMTANDAGTGFVVRWSEEAEPDEAPSKEPETKIEAAA